MTDYKKSTGSSGTMIIRDNGSTVSLLINAGNPYTFIYELPWGYTINGVTNNSRESRYEAGDGWVTLGSWTVTTDQTVTFRLFTTGLASLGGPTTLTAEIDRASIPSTPSKPLISEITATSMRVRWSAGSANGAAIDLYQVARNISNTVSGATIINTDTDNVFTGLASGLRYYWWARTRNAKGYSAWSPVAYASTIKVGDAPDQPVISDPTQTSFVVSFSDNGNGGATILERQLIINTVNSTLGGTPRTYTGVTVVDGLQPATTYYVWARVRNSAGWGPYSSVAVVTTIAGIFINVGGEWKQAVPYVKDGGVWKLARPWGRIDGLWKETE